MSEALGRPELGAAPRTERTGPAKSVPIVRVAIASA